MQGKQLQYTMPFTRNGERDFVKMPNFILIEDKGSQACKKGVKLKISLAPNVVQFQNRVSSV